MAIKKQETNISAPQKSGGKFWIIIGMIALFVCGGIVGIFVSNSKTSFKQIGMSESDCSRLASQIVEVNLHPTYGNYEDVAKQVDANSKKLKELNDVYTKNCYGRVVEVKEPAPQPQPEPLPDETCGAVEALLTRQMAYYDENSTIVHDHLSRAQTYANMANRGCAENAETYKALALREIEIARALSDDKFDPEGELQNVIDTYKKLNMKAEAEKVFEKVKKMTDPAIDFILQVEKIINE